MTGDLIINGYDSFSQWGVNMGDNFIDNLEAPAAVKTYIENESRIEHGKTVITDPTIIKIASRDVTLQFHVCGNTKEEYLNNKRKFIQEVLYAGAVNIQIPSRGDDVYHLIYTGKQASFSQTETEGKLSAKFEEPNPMDRV